MRLGADERRRLEARLKRAQVGLRALRKAAFGEEPLFEPFEDVNVSEPQLWSSGRDDA